MKKIHLSDEELLDKLNEMLVAKEGTENCHFNSVIWHETDQLGLNWDVSVGSSGRSLHTCMHDIDEVLEKARKIYLLKDNN